LDPQRISECLLPHGDKIGEIDLAETVADEPALLEDVLRSRVLPEAPRGQSGHTQMPGSLDHRGERFRGIPESPGVS
jgi:hypothetical protein